MNKLINYIKYISGILILIIGPILSMIWLISDKLDQTKKELNIAPLLLFILTIALGVILFYDGKKRLKVIETESIKKFKPFKRK